jgi:hypothetical protein
VLLVPVDERRREDPLEGQAGATPEVSPAPAA